MAPRKKHYNPDPQSFEDEPEIPEVDDFDELYDDNDDFDSEPDYDDEREESIMDRGIDADDNLFH